MTKSQRSIRRNLWAGTLIGFLLVGGVGGWAATTEISGAVIAPGALVVDTNLRKVQHPTGGVIGEINRIDIRAPIDGVVHQSTAHTVGGVIAPGGEPIMLVVPESDKLTVEARVAPQDIDQLHVGQAARVRFLAFNQRTNPGDRRQRQPDLRRFRHGSAHRLSVLHGSHRSRSGRDRAPGRGQADAWTAGRGVCQHRRPQGHQLSVEAFDRAARKGSAGAVGSKHGTQHPRRKVLCGGSVLTGSAS